MWTSSTVPIDFKISSDSSKRATTASSHPSVTPASTPKRKRRSGGPASS